MTAVLVFFSGFSALVYQILWLRLLGLVFGVTVYAASTVLAAFMAGLALGSFFAGRFADRVRHPLRWFGAAEVLIAGFALSTPLLLDALEALYTRVYATVANDLGLLSLTRFICSFLVLLIPTTLMGATMPLVLRASVMRAPEMGVRASLLYGANTAGALAGTLLTGYYLISHAGIATSFKVAAICNLAVGLLAMLWPGSALVLPQRNAQAPMEEAREAGLPSIPDSTRRLVLAAFTVSGFVGLALEIIWFRTLVIFLPATTYAFTIVLAVVLGGFAAGSAIARFWLQRDRDWIPRLACLAMGTAVAAVGSLVALAWTYGAGWTTNATLQGTMLAVFPTTLLMGVAFPIGLHCWTRRGPEADARVGDQVGRFYVFNLAGSISGALIAGFVLVPRFGTRGSLLIAAVLSLMAGLALLIPVLRSNPRLASGLAAGGLALFAGVAALAPDPLQAVLSRRYPGDTLLWREEGAQATVSVQQQGPHRVMYLDGLHQADDSRPMLITHRLIGTLAMALHPDPRDALVVGLGGGATAGAVARFSNAAVDVVELSPSVRRGAEWFRHANGDVLRLPNVRLRIDDGRNHLLLTATRYDVITADIIQPYLAGAGSLYSLEYFRLAANALRDDGLMLQWIGLRPETEYKLIARTFQTVFPHTTVWWNGGLLVGTKQPFRLALARYRERLQDPAFTGALGSVGIAGFGGLVRVYTAGSDELRRFTGAGPILTDDRPLLEYFLSLPQGQPDVSLAGLKGDVNRHIVP